MMITLLSAKLSSYLDVTVGKSKATGKGSHLSGRITAHILTEGILTPALLNQLHEEWANSKRNVNKMRPELTTEKLKEKPRGKSKENTRKGKK